VRILCLADTRFPIERANGAQTMATCQALAARGHDVTLVVRPDTAAPPRDPFAFYGLRPVPTLRIGAVPASSGARVNRVRFLLAGLQRALESRGAVVYTRDLGLASFLLRLPAARRPPVVYESHGIAPVVAAEMPRLLGKPELTPPRGKLDRLDRRERRVWQRAEAYVTITRALRVDLAERYGPRPSAAVVPDGAALDTDADARGMAQSTRPFVAGYAGHFYPWKGTDVLVRAIALTKNVHATLVGGHPGEPDLARVTTLVSTLGLASRVTITGLVPWPEVRSHLRLANALVLPNTASAISERYTSPLKLFEYLTLGVPIVASDLPAIREIITANESALLVPPGDAAALAAALERLAAQPELAVALGAAAKRLAPEYTWDRRAERLEVVLATVAP
jgi:glycosyltransferase involved in cell wall biosynthesis